MNALRVVGISHRTAPLELRERLAVPPGEVAATTAALLESLGGEEEAGECVIVNTCNRVEVYAAGDKGVDLFAALCDLRDETPADFAGRCYAHDAAAAVGHLFRVAASLDSLVPGETQILGQVRNAYELARRHGFTGPRLHGLFQRAVAVGREVQTTTDLAAGRLSVASVAADYAEEIFDTLADKTVLCVGAGKMARLVVERLRQRRVGRLVVANRDVDKARRFAASVGGEGRPLSDLAALLAEADVVVTGTGSREPIVTAASLKPVMRKRRYRPLFLIDIAVPRDVEPAAADLTNVYLYDVDDLEAAVAKTVEGRRGSIEAAEAIVGRHVAAYAAWHRGRELGPTIRQLFEQAHAGAAEEVERSLRRMPDLDAAGRRQVEEMARRIVNKLLHGPVSTLRRTADDDRHGAAYRHAVGQLFSLGDGPAEATDADE